MHASASSSRSGPTGSRSTATRHAAVWPDMLRALHETGWHNYSLFLRDDGLLIGYFETPDLDAAAQAGDGRPPRSTPGGRPRWPSSSRSSTAAAPTRASSSSRRSSTWRTSCREADTTHREVM